MNWGQLKIRSVTCVLTEVLYHFSILSERWWVRDSLFTKILYKFCRFYRIDMLEKLE